LGDDLLRFGENTFSFLVGHIAIDACLGNEPLIGGVEQHCVGPMSAMRDGHQVVRADLNSGRIRGPASDDDVSCDSSCLSSSVMYVAPIESAPVPSAEYATGESTFHVVPHQL
jgi:hypothetical protein